MLNSDRSLYMDGASVGDVSHAEWEGTNLVKLWLIQPEADFSSGEVREWRLSDWKFKGKIIGVEIQTPGREMKLSIETDPPFGDFDGTMGRRR